ncbi:MAG: rhodanese-like domain-containing protein [Spirochaetota bacterium]
MSRKVVLTVLILVLAVGFAAAGGSQEKSDYYQPEQLKSLIDTQHEEYTLIDVRTADEFSSGHIPSSINIPVGNIENNPPEVEKDSLIIVYCRSGNRSARAADILNNLGYSNTVDFGGINRWDYELAY